MDKAVTLFGKGGNNKKAMELAIKYNLGHLIEDIPTGDSSDPEVMRGSVQFLL